MHFLYQNKSKKKAGKKKKIKPGGYVTTTNAMRALSLSLSVMPLVWALHVPWRPSSPSLPSPTLPSRSTDSRRHLRDLLPPLFLRWVSLAEAVAAPRPPFPPREEEPPRRPSSTPWRRKWSSLRPPSSPAIPEPLPRRLPSWSSSPEAPVASVRRLSFLFCLLFDNLCPRLEYVIWKSLSRFYIWAGPVLDSELMMLWQGDFVCRSCVSCFNLLAAELTVMGDWVASGVAAQFALFAYIWFKLTHCWYWACFSVNWTTN